ncbi:MAG: AAA family ATPase [Candidatus Rokubacteria bacterium]|nr:AAA family ATPase [Candidatus Rokubacteria bacterium]
MRCSRCQQENPALARFCMRCGAGLRLACASCSTELPPDASFCSSCGRPVAATPAAGHAPAPEAYTPTHLARKILASRSALEGERKQVTVLFVDVSGFTSLSERADPEDVHRLMTGAFELMLAEVHRYEGTVNQFLGDGIMALFGAPIAHEDHAQRAVQAALGIRRALERYRDDLLRRHRTDFQVRQGLNTGLVVVGSIGNDLRMDYTAVGDTTNVAARLQQMAQSGSIVIAQPTYRLIAGYVHARALGELRLKGKTEPVSAWEVVAAREARSRLDVDAERGLSDLVGREREMAVLWDCFEKARGGQGQIVFIVGEPGIGKSRLLYELRRRVDARAGWLEGRCLSFGRSVPFHPLIDLLRRRLGIEDGDGEDTVIARIEDALLPLGDDLRPILPYVRYLLGVEPGDAAVSSMDPQERRGELFAALRRLVLREAERLPQVMVYEDVHWTDKATEDYLALVADSLPTNPVLLVLTYRTGYSHPFGERSYQTRIVPGALSTGDSVAIACAMLAAERLPEDLQALVVRKAEGNPFFVEELVKSLREAGVIRRGGEGWVLTQRLENLVVPDTVQDVIAARIDRLAEGAKRVLQAASVIGRRFSRRLLEKVADAGARTETLLRDLTALELLHETRVFPEFEYTFKHTLTQEVAYASLLVQRRQELHRLIAVTIEDLYADRLAEQSEVLAHHFEKAEVWDKALAYRMRAADKAARACATRDALASYDGAEAIADRLRDGVPAGTRMAIQRGRAALYVLVSDFDRARSEWEGARRLASAAGDRHAEGEALVGMGQASWLAHRFDQALEDSRQAAEIADTIGAPSILTGSLLNEAIVYEVTDRLGAARTTFDRALALSRRTNDAVNEAIALVFGAELESWEGHYARAAQLYEDGIRLGRTHNVLVTVLEGLFMSGVNFTSHGAYDRALAVLDEGLALAERVGDENYTPRYLNSLGWLHMECGSLDRARELNRRAAEGGRKRGDHESFANAELNLGDIALLTGDLALAREYLEGVHRLVEDPATSQWMRWRYSIHLFASLADLALARGDLSRAREHADACLERATRTRSRKYLAKGWRLRGEIARARRTWADAEHALREALTLAEVIANPTQLWQTHAALGRLHMERKTPEAARQADLAARSVIERMKSGLHDPGLRASLEAAPHIRGSGGSP